jgi:hypothetical protein
MKPVHMLWICLALAAAIFAGAIALSVFYVEQNRIAGPASDL